MGRVLRRRDYGRSGMTGTGYTHGKEITESSLLGYELGCLVSLLSI